MSKLTMFEATCDEQLCLSCEDFRSEPRFEHFKRRLIDAMAHASGGVIRRAYRDAMGLRSVCEDVHARNTTAQTCDILPAGNFLVGFTLVDPVGISKVSVHLGQHTIDFPFEGKPIMFSQEVDGEMVINTRTTSKGKCSHTNVVPCCAMPFSKMMLSWSEGTCGNILFRHMLADRKIVDLFSGKPCCFTVGEKTFECSGQIVL